MSISERRDSLPWTLWLSLLRCLTITRWPLENTLLQLSPCSTIANNWRSHSWHYITVCAGHHLWIQQQWRCKNVLSSPSWKKCGVALSVSFTLKIWDFFGDGDLFHVPFCLKCFLWGFWHQKRQLLFAKTVIFGLLVWLLSEAVMVACVINCLSFDELDKMNPLNGETAVFSYQTAVLSHELESYRSRTVYSTLHSSPNLCA